MSKRTNFEKSKNDLYETFDPKALFPMQNIFENKSYIEPFVGGGALVKNIDAHTENSVCVYQSDIEPFCDETFSPVVHDVFNPEFTWSHIAYITNACCFITNPPWTNSKKSDYQLNRIIELLADVRPTWMLLNSTYMFNHQSNMCMKYCSDIYTVGRMKWKPMTQFSATEDSCWHLFDKNVGTNGPIIHPREKIYTI